MALDKRTIAVSDNPGINERKGALETMSFIKFR